MKDYERYMNRQKVSDAGMETLLKLETQRPERPRREESRVPQWLKYVGMAACFCLMMGLFALPILQGARQRAAGPNVTGEPAEELFFHAVDSVPFTDHGIVGGMKLIAMEQEDAAAIFGSAPDDFAGFLETVGLRKFDMEYYNVDMAGQGDDSCRFLMKGVYISPREGEVPPATSFVPVNTVWLEIYEGHSYLDEGEWKELESCTFHGHQVTAACVEDNYRAAAAFHVESGGKTYGVLYSVTADGERNAKEVVTKMVDYITQNGLFVEERETVTDTGVVGPYYLETEEDMGDRTFLPVVTFYQDGNFQCTSDLASSHYCVGSYTVKDGRVTANCDQHRFVFDIDGDALRYVGAESDKMVRYIAPEVTDGAVFRRPDGADQWGRTYEHSPFRCAKSPRASLEPEDLEGKYYMEIADGDARKDSYLDIGQKMTVHFASRNCVCDATLYNTTRDRITFVCSDCKSVYTFDVVDADTLRYVASGNKDCIDDCTVFRHLRDGETPSTVIVWGEPTHHAEESHHSDSHH